MSSKNHPSGRNAQEQREGGGNQPTDILTQIQSQQHRISNTTNTRATIESVDSVADSGDKDLLATKQRIANRRWEGRPQHPARRRRQPTEVLTQVQSQQHRISNTNNKDVLATKQRIANRRWVGYNSGAASQGNGNGGSAADNMGVLARKLDIANRRWENKDGSVATHQDCPPSSSFQVSVGQRLDSVDSHHGLLQSMLAIRRERRQQVASDAANTCSNKTITQRNETALQREESQGEVAFDAYVVNEEEQEEHRRQRERELLQEIGRRLVSTLPHAERMDPEELVRTPPHAERMDPEELRQQREQEERAEALRRRKLLMRKAAAFTAVVVAIIATCVVAVRLLKNDGGEPSMAPFSVPSAAPTAVPSAAPTSAFVVPNAAPTAVPSAAPTSAIFLELVGEFSEISGRDTFRSHSSPQYLATEWLAYTDTWTSESDWTPEPSPKLIQRYLMAVFFFALGGNAWRACAPSDASNCGSGNNINSWLSSTDECTWFSLRCNEQGMLQRIDFIDDDVRYVREQTLLSGTIPMELALLTDLELLFAPNMSIRGNITNLFSHMSKLKTLVLFDNDLSGPCPPFNSVENPVLETLQLGDNKLTGKIPTSLSGLTNLEVLSLMDNQLTGIIPSELGELETLRILELNDNNFFGEFPSTFYNPYLEELHVGFNNLLGTLGSQVGAMVNIAELGLGGNAIGGTIPSEIFRLPRLQVLDLQRGDFYGPLSPDIILLNATLEELYLNNNGLTGPIPTELGGLTGLSGVWLESNHLTGTIPSELAGLEELNSLSLYNNALTDDVSELCFNQEDGDMSTGLEQLSFFYADCDGNGVETEVVCPCCTHCCNDMTGACIEVTTLEKECQKKALQWQGSANDDSGTVCQCSEGGHVVSCKDSNCMYCNDADGSLCYIDAGTGMELGIEDASFAVSLQYVRGRDELVSLRQSDGQCLAAINGRDCASCRGILCLGDGYRTYEVDCSNLGYGGALSACNEGDDPFVLLWDVVNALFFNGSFPVRHDCVRVTREELITGIVKKVSGNAIYNKASPRHDAFRWLVHEDPMQLSVGGEGVVSYTVVERYVIVLFFLVTGGLSSWTNNLGFLSSTSVCDWHLPSGAGVHCHVYGAVQVLTIGGNKLYGTLPDELSALEQLEEIDLFQNVLYGTMPGSLEMNTMLKSILLSENLLSGTITPFASQDGLEVVDLSQNLFKGSIPQSLGYLSFLKVLYLDDNLLSGSIPTSIWQAARLQDLLVYHNSLTGSIPTWIGQATQLLRLYARNNSLTGTIPAEIGNLNRLWYFTLNGNGLTGTIPTEIGYLRNLEFFSLSSNGLTGPIPTELGGLTGLSQVYLYGNHLTGTIPSELAGLEELGYLNLSNNTLTGDVSEQCFNQEDGDMSAGLEQLSEFYADCDGNGVEPEVICPCCTHCCNDMTGACSRQRF